MVKKYQIKLILPNDKSLITKYLQNYHNDISQHYQNDALKVLENFFQNKISEENISIVAEDALQQLLFEVENLPV